jgi:hypothetical protein
VCWKIARVGRREGLNDEGASGPGSLVATQINVKAARRRGKGGERGVFGVANTEARRLTVMTQDPEVGCVYRRERVCMCVRLFRPKTGACGTVKGFTGYL